ncbi:hypothetical protein PsorP6_004593 [Peronosclerospora sorghi]|uniref:Uncharacterized protein n=1 Tax=Peronosclerospora sorghi TaxID=230839 RepID=A0ACC0VLR7_9STRA|nr:hypothetical protein PsorP6_004593 [Peronosclerospora sorghi]
MAVLLQNLKKLAEDFTVEKKLEHVVINKPAHVDDKYKVLLDATAKKADVNTTVQRLHKFATPLDGTQFDMGVTLGTGSFGLVRFATHKVTNTIWAIKILKKAEIIRLQQVEHMHSKNSILLCMNHPFIVNLAGTYQDTKYLYMVLEDTAKVWTGGRLEFCFTRCLQILSDKLNFPRFFDRNAMGLIKRMITADLTKRYECLKNGVVDIKKHKFFADVVWEDLLGRKSIAPIIPRVGNANDTSNFDPYADSMEDAIVPVYDGEDPFAEF